MAFDVVKYNVLGGELRIVKKGLFQQIKTRYFMLFSSKSLYPNLYVSEHFLTDNQLPPWLEVNCLYEIKVKDNKRTKLFHVKEIASLTGTEDESKD